MVPHTVLVPLRGTHSQANHTNLNMVTNILDNTSALFWSTQRYHDVVYS